MSDIGSSCSGSSECEKPRHEVERRHRRRTICCSSKPAEAVLRLIASESAGAYRFVRVPKYTRTSARAVQRGTFFFCGSEEQALARLQVATARQRVARLLGSSDMCAKVPTMRALQRAVELQPERYAFWPRSFALPGEVDKLGEYFSTAGGPSSTRRPVIVKPSEGSQGDGIWFCLSRRQLEARTMARAATTTTSASRTAGRAVGGLLASSSSVFDGCCAAGNDAIAQVYIDRPLLLDGLKFDLRVYVLVTSLAPLEVFLCREGMARFCTEPYEPLSTSNCGNVMAQLTNYSLNKRSNKFVHSDAADGGESSKRTLSSLLDSLEARGTGGFDRATFWARLEHLVAATCSAIAPSLRVAAHRAGVPDGDRRCFQVFGFDVLMDEACELFLLELNAQPSLNIESEINVTAEHPLPADARLCRGTCMTPYAHYHMICAVDATIKRAVLTWAMRIVLDQRVGAGDAPSTAMSGAIDFALERAGGEPLFHELVDPLVCAFESTPSAQRTGKLTLSALRQICSPWLDGRAGLTTRDLDLLQYTMQKQHGAIGFDQFLAIVFEIAKRKGVPLAELF